MWILPQIIYDEGPLYIFAKTEEVRALWIKKLKECKYVLTQIDTDILCLTLSLSHSRYYTYPYPPCTTEDMLAYANTNVDLM